MATKQHYLEQIGEDLTAHVEEASEYLADAFYDGKRAPFAADVNEAKLLEVYRDQWFLPDGALDLAYHEQVKATAGADGYYRITKAIWRAMGSPPIDRDPLLAEPEIRGEYPFGPDTTGETTPAAPPEMGGY